MNFQHRLADIEAAFGVGSEEEGITLAEYERQRKLKQQHLVELLLLGDRLGNVFVSLADVAQRRDFLAETGEKYLYLQGEVVSTVDGSDIQDAREALELFFTGDAWDGFVMGFSVKVVVPRHLWEEVVATVRKR